MQDANPAEGNLCLDVNLAGSWRRVMQFAPFDAERIKIAVLQMAGVARGHTTWRITDAERNVVDYCAPTPGTLVPQWRAA